ncbi:MAG: translocation/assembly module TamB domain-containing protein [Gemmatimonadota bacterium]
MSMRIAGFIVGLLIAVALVGLWVMFTGGSEESFNPPDPQASAATDRGLIGSMHASIAARMRQERRAVRPVRANLTFRVQQILWEDDGAPAFARAAEMRGRLDTRALAAGDIIVRGVNIRDAAVYVEQNAREEWNYRRVLDRLLEDSDRDGPERSFIVFDVAIQNTDVQVQRPDQRYAINDVAAQLPRVDFAGPHIGAPRVNVARATGLLVAGDSTYPLLAENAQLELEEGQMNFTVARITTVSTRIVDFTGSWGTNFPGFGLVGRGRAENLRFQDVRFVSARLPARGTAAFAFQVLPISSQMTEIRLADARMTADGSNISGSGTIRLTESAVSLEAVDARFDPLDLALVEQLLGDTLPYRGTVTGTATGTGGIISFDVTTRLTSVQTRAPLITRLSGAARVGSDRFELRRLEAMLRDAPLASLGALIPGLPLKGNISGRITLTGTPERAPLTLNLRTELASGVAIVEGTVDLTGSVPRYDLEGRLIAINLQQLLEPAAPPVFMTTHFSIDGSGVDPNTLRARVHAEGRFTGWRTGPNDSIHLAARVQNGTVSIDSAGLRLATLSANATGQWRFAEPAAGAIEYTVAFEPITPFGPYIPLIGDEDAAGSVRIAGTVMGQLSRIEIAGSGNATDFMVGDWSAASVDGKYQLVLGPAVPEISIDANARDLRTPTAGAYQTAQATIRLQSPTFALDIRADRVDGEGGLEIIADGRIPATGQREVILQRARIDIGAEQWSLSRPAIFTWAGPDTDLNVRGFELRRSDDVGLLRVEGRVLPLANADFQLETTALPVGDLQLLLGRRPIASGALTTNTVVRAVNGVPQLTTTFQLDRAVVENVRFSQLTGNVAYSGQRLIANATARVDTTGTLELRAELPLDLRFGEDARPRLRDAGAVNVTLVSDSIALAPFAALNPDLADMGGTLSTDIRVSGTVEQPVLSGSIDVRNGAVRIIRFNQYYDSINASIVLENRAAVIRDFIARSGGRLRLAGTVEFQELNRPVLDITALMDRFELIGVDNRDDAQASGQLQLRGPVAAAVLTGALTIDDGYLPIPQTGASALDAELARFEAELPEPGEDVARTPFYSGLRIADLRITAADNLWFAVEDARAELLGTLNVDKSGESLRVTGELAGTRGTYVLRAGPIIRRFEITHAYIRFLGGDDLNPAVDITARRRVVDLEGRQLDIDVRIGGTLRSPTLALASETAAPIPQSELLSFLLFGQPSFALGGSTILPGQDVITEAVVGGVSELISLELEQTVIDQLGTSFDVFQIRLGGGSLEQFTPSLVVGEEIAPNLFLTVESVVSSLFRSTTGASTSFAVHLEWRISQNMTLRGSHEPVNEIGLLRGYTAAQPALRPAQYQKTLELRRRWAW